MQQSRSPSGLRAPSFLKPVLRVLYELHFLTIRLWRLLINFFYRSPLFQGRCATFGRNVTMDGLPFVHGPVELHIGNDCIIGGNVSILSGALVNNPSFIMKDFSGMGWNCTIIVSKEVIIGEHARVSYDCRISDTDGHPREADLRARNCPPHLRDIRAVHIGRYAWIGNGTHVMKGVTIGEGAIIGANSVVISDIPPYALALGNPAEVLIRGYGKPKDKSWNRPAQDTGAQPADTAILPKCAPLSM